MSAPLPPLAPAPEPGPGVPVDVRPEDYYRVAQDFVDGQNRVMRSYEALTRSLGELSGAAGNDEPAQKFSESYTPAVRTLFSGFVRLHELLGGIARGLAISAENHRRADAEAAGGDPGEGFAPLWADKCPAASEPPPILGDGDTNLLATISDWVNPYYPNGHVDKMHDVAAAFAAARDSLNDTANDLHARLQSLATTSPKTSTRWSRSGRRSPPATTHSSPHYPPHVMRWRTVAATTPSRSNAPATPSATSSRKQAWSSPSSPVSRSSRPC